MIASKWRVDSACRWFDSVPERHLHDAQGRNRIEAPQGLFVARANSAHCTYPESYPATRPLVSEPNRRPECLLSNRPSASVCACRRFRTRPGCATYPKDRGWTTIHDPWHKLMCAVDCHARRRAERRSKSCAMISRAPDGGTRRRREVRQSIHAARQRALAHLHHVARSVRAGSPFQSHGRNGRRFLTRLAAVSRPGSVQVPKQEDFTAQSPSHVNKNRRCIS